MNVITNNNIKYFSCKLAEMTGPDGGMGHSWVCKNIDCDEYNIIKDYSDK
jgi:hypothetical protein